MERQRDGGTQIIKSSHSDRSRSKMLLLRDEHTQIHTHITHMRTKKGWRDSDRSRSKTLRSETKAARTPKAAAITMLIEMKKSAPFRSWIPTHVTRMNQT